jgi:hypothetical protein
MRKLNWFKAHNTSAVSPEVSKYAKWLIETLQAIIARWEEVLPYVAKPCPKPPNSPSAFSQDAIPEPPRGRENLLVLRDCLEARGTAIMGQPFVDHLDIIAEMNLPGFGTTRVLKVFKLYEAQKLALHARFVRNLILGLEELESACKEHRVRFTIEGAQLNGSR